MEGYAKTYDDVTKHISFEDISDNFYKAAKFGFDTKFTWFNDAKISLKDLIINELVPIAREGLASRGVDQKDITKYMDIIEERAKAQMTGARWLLRAYTKLAKEVTPDEALTTVTAAIAKNQWADKPVHTWEMPTANALENYQPSSLKVEEFMQTDLFTTQKEDIIEFVAQLMDWRKIRYMPVEDAKGKLVGLITSRLLLREFTHSTQFPNEKHTTVGEIMIENPKTVKPTVKLADALDIMRNSKIGCLPVVNDENMLVGIITEMDFLRISSRLIQRVEK